MTVSLPAVLAADTGSFRDPANRVYVLEGGRGVYRGVNATALENYQRLEQEPFFKDLLRRKRVVGTQLLADDDPNAREILAEGWAGVLEHDPMPFISYPYEWSFSMLKDAALLQLSIIEDSLEHGWTLKDATPYNIQFVGARPVFIDIPSFEPWQEGKAWVGYRQFCSMFLTPLMLRAHLGIDQLPLLRSYIDGIPPTEAIKFFAGTKRFKKGVLSHIALPARVENSIARRERDDAKAKQRTGGHHSKAMVVGLVQSLRRLVRRLKADVEHTDWAKYDKTHSYDDEEHEQKKAFVEQVASATPRDHVWDIGCNTGTFSRLCTEHANAVIAIDGDASAVEQLYLAERDKPDGKIFPLIVNLANISPNQGWAGAERKALDARKKPDLVLCLALIHHMRLSANIPSRLFLKWLRSLNAEVVIEFVDRHDEMVAKLLTNKAEQYADYNLEQFVREAEIFFEIAARQDLKGGKRVIFHLKPNA